MPVTSDDVKLEIFNLSLMHIGERPAAALNEQSKGAVLLARIYDRTVKTVLSGFPWDFATETAALVLTTVQPTAYKYALTYDLPTDCLRARKIITAGMAYDADSQIEFKREGAKLKCNVDDAVLVYTKSITDATLFDPLFVDVLSKYLAVHISLPVTGKPEVQSNVFRLLQLTAPHAEATQANEKNEKGPIDGSIAGSRA
jgi:hypothetical protein